MDAAATGFYVTGGTLQQDAACYVERRADADLADALTRGEYCYVLTARQMGKSSLMIRTAARLRAAGIAVVLLDLQAVGQNLSVEQWYDGLLSLIGQQLGQEDELEEFWLSHPRLGPLQRWMAALGEVVLPRCTGAVILFIDEIDVVRALPFSTDEFFAGIRECYNRRTQDPAFQRLAFCLLGVAAPADLISDTRTSPFNIGRRIELVDFTESEAAPLALGLADGDDFTTRSLHSLETQSTQRKAREGEDDEARAALQRVLYWTGGHPYLTQRLCRAVAERQSSPQSTLHSLSVSSVSLAKRVVKPSPSQTVDDLCDALFFTRQAREADDNLVFVRNRLLQSGVDLAALLDLYQRMRRGRRVADDETNPLATLLRLSGVARSVGGALQVRNRIYERVFDPEWVAAQMPDAEIRRQRAAYRRGLARAAAVAGVVLALVGGLGVVAWRQARRAEEGQRALRRTLYAADMSLANQAWEAGDIGRARELLEAQRPERVGEELRGFEWRLLWPLMRGDDRDRFTAHSDLIMDIGLSPDGRLLASCSFDKTIKLWDLARRREVDRLTFATGVRSMSVSSRGLVAGGLGDGTLVLWDMTTRRRRIVRDAHAALIRGTPFSPDGRLLATVSGDRWLRIWTAPECRKVAEYRCPATAKNVGLGAGAFAPDGKRVAIGTDEGRIILWNVATRRVETMFQGFPSRFYNIAFSPDGRTLAAGGIDGSLRLWDLAAPGTRPRLVADVAAHTGSVWDVTFAPDGRQLGTVSADNLVKLWSFTPASARRATERTGAARSALRLVETLRGQTAPGSGLVFVPDGKTLVTSDDTHIQFWDLHRRRETNILRRPGRAIISVAISADSRLLAAGDGDGMVQLWSMESLGGPPRARSTLRAHRMEVNSLAFSPDGRLLATAGEEGTMKLWDVATRRNVATLQGDGGVVGAVAFSPRGSFVASGRGDGTVQLWDADGRRLRLTLRGHTGGVRSVVFSPDGSVLASGSSDKTVRLWRLVTQRGGSTLRNVTVYRGHERGIRQVAFSPDGRLLASASWDNTVRLWDIAGKAAPAVLRGHRSFVQCLAFSTDGKTVASGSSDYTTRLWNVAARREVAVLKGPVEDVNDIAFSADGALLATANFDGTVRLWRAAPFAETDAAGDGSGRRVR